MASASTSAAANSESEERDFTDVEYDEEADDDEWVNAPFFPVEHILDEYKYQAKKAMKEPIIKGPTHKKIFSAFMENLKLQKMQYVSLHYDLKNVTARGQDRVSRIKYNT